MISDPITLEGQYASLVPLSIDHLDDLIEAVRDGELWKLWFTKVPSPEGMRAEIERRTADQRQGLRLPFAVVETASGRAVGMTNYWNIDQSNRRVEIGGTWYRQRTQRTAVNTECKLLLMTHAFETLDCIAVEFRTHILNRASRAGIERLGAKLDGILRSHQIADNGTLRDTCVYSVIAPEWPTVKAHLLYQLTTR
jgi:RimJ/RimL family protein N-acetyltransferase